MHGWFTENSLRGDGPLLVKSAALLSVSPHPPNFLTRPTLAAEGAAAGADPSAQLTGPYATKSSSAESWPTGQPKGPELLDWIRAILPEVLPRLMVESLNSGEIIEKEPLLPLLPSWNKIFTRDDQDA